MRDIRFCILLSLLLPFCVSCSVTTGATDGTSDSFEHTAGASTDLTEASTEVTSSTSPHGDSKDDDAGESKDAESKKKEEAKAFAERNLAKLERDMARGGGEYLVAVAEILEVEREKQAGFFELVKTSYSQIAKRPTSANEVINILYHLSKSVPG